MSSFTSARIIRVATRLAVWTAAIAFCLYFWISVAVLLLGGCSAHAGDGPVTVIPWDVETTRPAVYTLDPVYRGETVILEPRFLSQSEPMDLTSVYDVRMRYRHGAMAEGEYYIATGAVHNASGGIARVTWTPDNVPTGNVASLAYNFILQSTNGINPRAAGTIKLRGIVDGTATSQVPRAVTAFDWSLISEHLNTEAAPFVGPGDMLAVNQRLDGVDQSVLDLIDLVGDGVAGVTSNLQAYIVQAGQTNDAQDQLIALALQSANMGLDISGVSTQATVVATRGRAFPAANDIPQDMEAMVWDAVLGGMKWGSVDLGSIWTAISNLVSSSASQTYVDAEVSRVEGMVDGNDHVLRLTESFEAADWLEIASGVWQHNTYGWLASGAIVIGGDLRLIADVGTITMDLTNHVSKVAMTGGASQYMVAHAATLAGPWTGYDVAADNIAATNRFAVRVWNTSGVQVSIGSISLYSWTHPERVGAIRDFAGLTLRVDTPDGTDAREAANVGYVRTLAATGSISGTFATGFSVDKLKTIPLSISGLGNGMGMVYYSSVNEIRPVDVATQFELDAAVQPLATIAALNALTTRVGNTEAGTSVQLGGDLAGVASSGTVTRLLGANLPTGPVPAQHSLVMGASGWELKSILASNIVYATGTNDIASVPANAAAFYRASYNGGIVGVMVLDQQVVCWFDEDGWTIPHGNLSIYEQLIESNIHLLDGSLVAPALAFASEPGLGISRASSGGETVIRFGKANNAILDIGASGITLSAGKTISGLTGYASTSSVAAVAASLNTVSGRVDTVQGWGDHASAGYANTGTVAAVAASINTVSGRVDTVQGWGDHASAGYATGTPVYIETDPFAVLKSATVVAWTNAGGAYTNEGVIATSPASSNGYAAVTYDLSAGNGMSVVIQMSDLNLTTWDPFVPFATPGYVRVSLVESLPPPDGVLDTTISNISATAWTRPDLVGAEADTAGQSLLVDAATAPRQAVPLSQMQAAVAGVQPSTWAAYPASQNVNLAGKLLIMGQGWTVTDNSGLGVISYTDLAATTNGLQISANLVPAITATAGYSGLTIATLAVDGGTGTVGVATNGVTTTPVLQWTASLMSINWQNLTPISETYPSTNAAGHYEIVAVLPDAGSGFLRAVQPSGTSRVDIGMPLYELGERVATTSLVAAVSGRVDAVESWAAASIAWSGTNLLIVSDGVTNRVLLEAYSE